MMTENELNDATMALIHWLQGQGISPIDSVPVCAKAICVAILSLHPPPDELGADDSAQIAGEMILSGVRTAWKAQGRA